MIDCFPAGLSQYLAYAQAKIREIREIGTNIKNVNTLNTENAKPLCGSANVRLPTKSSFWLLIYNCISTSNWNHKYFFNCANFGVFHDVYRGNKQSVIIYDPVRLFFSQCCWYRVKTTDTPWFHSRLSEIR